MIMLYKQATKVIYSISPLTWVLASYALLLVTVVTLVLL